MVKVVSGTPPAHILQGPLLLGSKTAPVLFIASTVADSQGDTRTSCGTARG
jgi:hypothetical protein